MNDSSAITSSIDYLKELFKQQWVAEKPMTARQIASGIGASA